MSKITVRITRRMLGAVKLGGHEYDIWDTEVSGFHARVGKRGISLRVSYYNLAGKRRVLTLGKFGLMTVEAGRQAAREVLAAVIQGRDPRQVEDDTRQDARKSYTTVGEYLDGPYTLYQNRLKDGSGTLRRIREDFPSWLKLPMVELTSRHVEKWQVREEAKKKARAFSTLKRSFGALQGMLNHAAQRDVIPANPIKGIRLQKPALTEEELIGGSERRYLEDSEIQALFTGLEQYQDRKRARRRSSRAHGKPYLPCLDDVAYVDHVKPWVLTMLYTGFRPGDLFGLRWEHVNLQFKTIRKVIEKTAHHHPEPQTFPLSVNAVEVLKQWHDLQGKPSKGYVFPSPVTGTRLASSAMRKPWKAIKTLCGLDEELDLYALRHNFASQLVMAGVDLLTVSRLMGHSNIETTIKFYAHLKPDHQRDAVEKMSMLMKAPLKQAI